MNNYSGEKFLNRLYSDLHMNDEVMHTASKSDNKDEKVKKYLNRLEKVENLALSSKHNGLELLKQLYYNKYVIKEEELPTFRDGEKIIEHWIHCYDVKKAIYIQIEDECFEVILDLLESAE